MDYRIIVKIGIHEVHNEKVWQMPNLEDLFRRFGTWATITISCINPE